MPPPEDGIEDPINVVRYTEVPVFCDHSSEGKLTSSLLVINFSCINALSLSARSISSLFLHHIQHSFSACHSCYSQFLIILLMYNNTFLLQCSSISEKDIFIEASSPQKEYYTCTTFIIL